MAAIRKELLETLNTRPLPWPFVEPLRLAEESETTKEISKNEDESVPVAQPCLTGSQWLRPHDSNVEHAGSIPSCGN